MKSSAHRFPSESKMRIGHTPTRSRAYVLILTTALVTTLTGCVPAAELSGDFSGGQPQTQTLAYTGSAQNVTVPEGATSVTVVATGGDGGFAGDNAVTPTAPGFGAVVTGTIAVEPGDQLIIGVGGVGQNGQSGSANPGGGWALLNAHGGDGKGETDHLRTSSGGGGASTVQLQPAAGSAALTKIVAAGGGGAGASSGDGSANNHGGTAGKGWNGGNGGDGSSILGAKGGMGGAGPDSWGAPGGHSSNIGGNGGGGGGGWLGGAGGGGAKGSSAGGGGGSGSSFTADDVTSASVALRIQYVESDWPANGAVSLQWHY
jgi:hypothetical protein